MGNEYQYRYSALLKPVPLFLVTILFMLLCQPVFAQATACAPGNTTGQTHSNNILTGDSVVAPWTNETPFQLRSSDTIDGIVAMRADLTQWAPIAFDSNGQVQAGGFDFIEFKIRSSIDNPPVNVIASSGIVCHLNKFINLEKNRWERVQLPLASLGLIGQQSIGRIKIKSAIVGAFTLWITDVRLLSNQPASEPLIDTPADQPPAEEPLVPVDNDNESPATLQFAPWHLDPGVLGEIDDHLPARIVILNANGQDRLDDSARFNAALDAISEGGILEIPAGTYYLSSSLQLQGDNQIIRGAGSNKTRLIFTESLPYGIAITGQYPQSAMSIVKGRIGSSRLIVERIQDAVTGKYALLSNARTQHSQVVSIIGQRSRGNRTVLLLARPLNSEFDTSASLQLFDANEYSGVEGLSVDVDTAATRIGDMIFIRSAAHAWIRDIVSKRARESHVFTRQAYACEVTGNTFLDATGHGDGKQGYGIDLANSTTGCLVENNTLGYLRHSILLNASANGNIIAFNHSFSPRHTNFAEGGPGDISFHSFTYANLVEGNVVERIHIGDAGSVGEGNLIHRNCLTSGPLTIDNSPNAVQYIYTNSMYGSNAQLQTTFMPPVLPETPAARSYAQPGTILFDDDGIIVSPSALAPSLINNWYQGLQNRTSNDTPNSFYGTRFEPLLTVQITDNWTVDCRIPAQLRARGQ